MTKRDAWLLTVTILLAIAYVADALTGALQRFPFLSQQALAILLGVSIGRVARIWLHN